MVFERLYQRMQYENILCWRVSLETGMRIGDVVALKPEQLNKRTITYIAEKTGKPDKKVISEELAKRLRGIAGKNYIFPHRTDRRKHRTRQAVWKDIKKASKEAKIKGNVAPHSARKMYAVDVFHEKGFNATQSALQHDNANTTMLYAFADMLTQNEENCENIEQKFAFSKENVDFFAEIVADKVVEKLTQLR